MVQALQAGQRIQLVAAPGELCFSFIVTRMVSSCDTIGSSGASTAVASHGQLKHKGWKHLEGL